MMRRSIAGARRPRSMTVLGWLFLCFGVLSTVAALLGVFGLMGATGSASARAAEFLPMAAVQAVAAVGGALVLRGIGLGRWLLLAWMTFHVVLSGFHPGADLLVHAAMLAILLYLFFRADANAYFRGDGSGAMPAPG